MAEGYRESSEAWAGLLRDWGFERVCGANNPKVVQRITDDEDELLAFFNLPAEHWIRLRTTNPIESTFAA